MKYMDIKLIVYDFDGVMTNNKAFIDQNGKEIVEVSRADGLGVSLIKDLKIKQIILSSETNNVVSARAKKLGLDCLQGVTKKDEILKKYLHKIAVSLDEVAYVGNDINDYDVMKIVKYTFCPLDANQSIKDISNIVLNVNGGNGVVRELYEFLIKEKGR
tara:strand:- start:174 stop:650 length:477 start_codon:yes stop_codon:yes gene_type:complete